MNIKINCRLSAYSKGTLPDLSKIVLEVNENTEGIYYVRTYDEDLKTGKWVDVKDVITEQIIELPKNSGLILNRKDGIYYELSINEELIKQSEFIDLSSTELDEERIYYVIEDLVPELYVNGGTAYSDGNNDYVINNEYEVNYFGGINSIDIDYVVDLLPLNSK